MKSSRKNTHTGSAGSEKKRRVLTPSEVLLYGHHPVYAALCNPQRTLLCLWHDKPLADDLAHLVQQRQLRHQQVPRQTLIDKVGANSLHQGLVLQVAPLPSTTLDDHLSVWQKQDRATVVILDQIADVRNLGAVMRSALCLGADAVLCTERHSVAENGHVAKAASGAWEALPCVRLGNVSQSIMKLRDHGFWCFAFSPTATEALHQITWPSHVALIFGAEGRGVRRLNQQNCDAMLSLPHNAQGHQFGVDSLNLAQSVAIALYARSITC